MNLPQFLKQVDRMTELYSKQELADFIHQRARILPESKRDSFLKQLTGMRDTETAVREAPAPQNLQQEISQALENLQAIEEDELYLIGNLNEAYDEWYHAEEEEFLF